VVRSDLAEIRERDRPDSRRRLGAARLLILAEEARLLLGPRLALAKAARDQGYEVQLAAPASSGRFDQAKAALAAGGLALWPMPVLEGLSGRLKELRLVGLFGALLDALKPDLVHCIGLRPVVYGGAVARLRRLATVLALPGTAGSEGADGARAALRRFLLRSGLALAAGNPKATIVIQRAEDRATGPLARALLPRRAFLIRGAAADLSVFRPAAPAERKPGPPVVLFAADSLGSADVQSFAAAGALLQAKGLAARFAILGEPDPVQAASARPEELAAYSQAGLIEWWGQPAEKPLAYRRADVFCVPGVSLDGIPGALVEALASGLPIVAGECAGTRPAVCHGANGLLTPPRDAQALAGALERLIADTAFRRSAGERSREIAEAEFSLEAFLTASLAVYRAALAGPLQAVPPPIETGRGA
jgi:glycosyltransferase involved in cell wall biosynthesis